MNRLRQLTSLLLATSMITSNLVTAAETFFFPTFEKSMLRNSDAKRVYNTTNRLEKNKDGPYHRIVSVAKNNYDVRKEINQNSTAENRIPHIIHQIWLGSPVPEKYKAWIKTWTEIEGWEYKLWTDQDVKQLAMVNRQAYEESKNWGEKADILRLEILYQFGGVYSDVDLECTNVEFLEFLCDRNNFLACYEPLEYRFFGVCNAFLASTPQHPLMEELVVTLTENRKNYMSKGPVYTTGPFFVTQAIRNYLNSNPKNEGDVLILPSTFFYPFSEVELIAEKHRKAPYKETVGIHYWSGSWR